MTGLKCAEKMSSDKVSGAEEDQPTTGKRKRSVLIGLIASLSTVLVLGAVLFGVVSYYQQKINDEKQEWISWSLKAGNTILHEVALIDGKEPTILMVSAESYRLQQDNSMALNDFGRGYVAIRDFQRNLCLVSNIPNPDFQSMKSTLEAKRGRQLDLPPRQEAILRPGNMTTSELGPKLSKFCNDVPAIWFDIPCGIEKRQTTEERETEVEFKLLGLRFRWRKKTVQKSDQQ